jgi:hypothetical protein
MAITYPLSTPTGVGGPAQIMISAENVVSTGVSPFNFSEQTYVHPGQRWLASVTLPPMKRERAEPWISFLMSLKGRQGYFLLNDPNALAPQGSVTGVISVVGDGQSGSTLNVDGFSANLVNAFKAGDYIQLGSGPSARLHKVLANVTAGASGNASLDIWPDLRSSPADNDVVTYVSASGLFRLTSNVTAWNIDAISSYGITFDCVEYVW